MVLQVGDKIPSFQGEAVFRGVTTRIGIDSYLRRFTKDDPRHLKHQKLLKKSYGRSMGSYVVILFYTGNFTLVSQKELLDFSDRMNEFSSLDCIILGCSKESLYSCQSWMRIKRVDGGLDDLQFPLLADKTGTICSSFQTLNTDGTVSSSMVLLGPDGRVIYVCYLPSQIPKSPDHVLSILRQVRDIEEETHQSVTDVPSHYSNCSAKGSSLRTQMIMDNFEREETDLTIDQELLIKTLEIMAKGTDAACQTSQLDVSDVDTQTSSGDLVVEDNHHLVYHKVDYPQEVIDDDVGELEEEEPVYTPKEELEDDVEIDKETLCLELLEGLVDSLKVGLEPDNVELFGKPAEGQPRQESESSLQVPSRNRTCSHTLVEDQKEDLKLTELKDQESRNNTLPKASARRRPQNAASAKKQAEKSKCANQ